MSKRFHFVHPKSQVINPNRVFNQEGAVFEDVICNFIDATIIANKIKNVNKRAVLVYKALGYCNWEIAINLGVSEITIKRYTVWLRRYLKELQNK